MANKDDELVLVVPSDKVFAEGTWQGLKTDNLEYYIDLINKNCQFKRRGDVENDPSFQQIIPYILFSFENKFFAYKYLDRAGEKRLINQDYYLGVGGHINKEDIGENKNAIEAGTMREWNEEVDFKGKFLSQKLVGIINDDIRPVEEVHLGLFYHFLGDSADIQIKETEKMEGMMIELKNLSGDKINQSPWAQIVYNEYLKKL